MLRLNNLTGFGGLRGTPFSLTYITNVTDGSIDNAFSVAGVSLGADVTGDDVRYTIIVGASSSGATTPNWLSGSVAGAALTEVNDGVTDARASATGCETIILYANTTGLGTTGTITANTDSDSASYGFGVYRLVNPGSIVASDLTIDTSNVSGLLNLSLTVPSGGLSLGATHQINGGTLSTWTGMTKNFSSDISASDWFSCAINTSDSGALTVTAQSADTSPSNMVGVSVCWAP